MDLNPISVRAVERPPSLSKYLLNNEAPSPSDLLALNIYLAQLSELIDSLRSEVPELPGVEDARESERCQIRGEHDLFSSLKSPIRKVPQEILGVIFAFAVGLPPYNGFTQVARLRAVCASWRHAALTTPGLWSDLTVDLGKWCSIEPSGLDDQMLLDGFKGELDPWLAIVTRKPPYHLKLTSTKEGPHQLKLAHYLLSATPHPGAVTLDSPRVVDEVMSMISRSGLILPSFKLTLSGQRSANFSSVGLAFPNITVLEVWTPLLLSTTPPFPHSSLQTLHLSDLIGRGLELANLIQELPSLRELNLDAREYLNVIDVGLTNLPVSFTHQRLETLVLNGEDLLYSLRHVSFPSLRLLAVECHKFEIREGEFRRRNVLSRIFQRTTTEPLLVDLRGGCTPLFVTHVAASLPSTSYLLVDVEFFSDSITSAVLSLACDRLEAVYCGRYTVDLDWLSLDEYVRETSSPLKVYLPTGLEGWEKGWARRDELRSYGIELEALPNTSIGSMLRSLMPVFSEHSSEWWTCELIDEFDT